MHGPEVTGPHLCVQDVLRLFPPDCWRFQSYAARVHHALASMVCSDLKEVGHVSSSEASCLEAVASEVARAAAEQARAPQPEYEVPWGPTPAPLPLLKVWACTRIASLVATYCCNTLSLPCFPRVSLTAPDSPPRPSSTKFPSSEASLKPARLHPATFQASSTCQLVRKAEYRMITSQSISACACLSPTRLKIDAPLLPPVSRWIVRPQR